MHPYPTLQHQKAEIAWQEVFICHVVSFLCLLSVASQDPHRIPSIICNNLPHSLSNSLDWMSIERSMDKYWTKYGAGIRQVQFWPFDHHIGWQIPTNMGQKYIIAFIYPSYFWNFLTAILTFPLPKSAIFFIHFIQLSKSDTVYVSTLDSGKLLTIKCLCVVLQR